MGSLVLSGQSDHFNYLIINEVIYDSTAGQKI